MINNRITAAQARELAIKPEDKHLERIYDFIKQNASPPNHKFTITFYDDMWHNGNDICKKVVADLRTGGFRVELGNGFEPRSGMFDIDAQEHLSNFMTVSW